MSKITAYLRSIGNGYLGITVSNSVSMFIAHLFIFENERNTACYDLAKIKSFTYAKRLGKYDT